MQNYFILYEYKGKTTFDDCKIIAENSDYQELMRLTKNKGHKFFINHSTRGGRFKKCEDKPETWLAITLPDFVYINV